MAQLVEWYGQYSERYQCVGRLIRSNQDRFIYDHSDEENVEDESDENIDEDIDKYCGIQSEVMAIPSISIYQEKKVKKTNDEKLDDLLSQGHEEIEIKEDINNDLFQNGQCKESSNDICETDKLLK